MQYVDDAIGRLPPMAEWEREVRIDHVYTEAMLKFCAALGIPPLGELLSSESGRIFCSTESLAPSHDLPQEGRAISVWVRNVNLEHQVEFHYSTRHVRSDTLRSDLREGAVVSIVAELHAQTPEALVFRPLVMGAPWLDAGQGQPDFEVTWWAHDFFENFVEDIDEFSRVRDVPTPPSPDAMRQVTEAAFKTCLARILGDAVPHDWGGEQSDYYCAHLHLNGRPATAAFLLKGPAHFAPMGLNHLGKNNDQIVRLAREPADMLVVQHCHDILPPVRDTLRAFAVQPSRPRRYCLIDGRDSLRLLQAYDLYDCAVAMGGTS